MVRRDLTVDDNLVVMSGSASLRNRRDDRTCLFMPVAKPASPLRFDVGNPTVESHVWRRSSAFPTEVNLWVTGCM